MLICVYVSYVTSEVISTRLHGVILQTIVLSIFAWLLFVVYDTGVGMCRERERERGEEEEEEWRIEFPRNIEKLHNSATMHVPLV
jgi:hypothetical protein